MPGKILVVDDMEPERELYARELREEGYEVDVAATGEEAVGKLAESAPDVVILDMSMPGMGGLEALGRMLQDRPGLPVIINSAYGSFKDSFMTWAAASFVVKSADLTELKSAVSAVLAGRGAA